MIIFRKKHYERNKCKQFDWFIEGDFVQIFNDFDKWLLKSDL